MQEPLNVNVVNRGDAAATGPGLVLGTIGLIIVFCLIAIGVVVLASAVAVLGPLVLVGWFLLKLGRLNARYHDYLEDMGMSEPEGWKL